MRQSNLVYLYKPEEKKVLLAMKKRSFGAGKWNGVGGKVDPGETMIESAIREVKEEIAVNIDTVDMKEVAVIDFIYKDNPEWEQTASVFLVEKWIGEPMETEEMQPVWYALEEIPYAQMWVTDKEWLPRILNGERLRARILFNKTGDTCLDMKIEKW